MLNNKQNNLFCKYSFVFYRLSGYELFNYLPNVYNISHYCNEYICIIWFQIVKLIYLKIYSNIIYNKDSEWD